MDILLITFGALFSIMNPLGTVPIFVSLTQKNDSKERGKIAFWTSINVLIILLLSFFAGKYILVFFGISINSLKIAGGLIIASSGFALLTGKFAEHKGMEGKKIKEDVKTRSEISLTPLAIPMLAGPGTISLLITYNEQYQKLNEIFYLLGAMFLAGLSVYFILKSSHYIVKTIGASGINALSRIIGFIVIAIGIEYILSATLSVIATL
jgi:multiple antibiotic resistance protein|tara:strand:- start:4055 stop:4681 length:627 start_codon:yes stop_codon:yes gene_type:complete